MTTFLVIVVIWASGTVTTSAAPYPSQDACSVARAEAPAAQDDSPTNTVAVCVPERGPE